MGKITERWGMKKRAEKGERRKRAEIGRWVEEF